MKFSNLLIKPTPVTTFSEVSRKTFSQTKLIKPKELKNIKPAFSIDFLYKKCRCKIYIENKNVWIQHRDYFSKNLYLDIQDIGKPFEDICKKYLGKQISKKFTYSDSFGCIVLRNEAWIKLENIISDLENNVFCIDILDKILREHEQHLNLPEFDLAGDWERFYEAVILKVREYVKGVDER